MEAAQKQAAEKPAFSEYDYSNFYYGAGDDPINLLRPYADWYRDARPNGYYLYQEALGSAPTTHVRVKNGRTGQWQDLLNLASYNYLGLARHPETVAAAKEALDRYGVGACGSPILSGMTDLHRRLESRLSANYNDNAWPARYSAREPRGEAPRYTSGCTRVAPTSRTM